MNPVPVVSIVGKSNSGKTTFLVRLIAELTRRGVRVATVKHHVHDYEIDVEGKDSWRHAQAGAVVSMVSSPFKYSVVRTVDRERTLDELREEAERASCDILLTEGFKIEGSEKFELSRMERSDAPVCPSDEIVGLITDNPSLSDAYRDAGLAVFGLDDDVALADFISHRYLEGRF